MIILALFPILLAIICVSFWSCYYKCYAKQEAHRYTGRMLSTLIILLFLVHPNIVKYSFNNFNCSSIDGEKRVYVDLEIVCNEGTHYFWSLVAAVPCIVVWGKR